MLKHRLISGTLMTILFTAVAILDGVIDGSITLSADDDARVKASLTCILLVIIVVAAQWELVKIAQHRQIIVFSLPCSVGAVLLASSWYFRQFFDTPFMLYPFFITAFTLMVIFLFQYIHCGTSNVVSNCGASCLAVLYTGLLSSFILGIRIDFGLWQFLSFIFVVKSADIGAYTIGKLVGKHPFSPRVSPGKTWEGLAGAIVFAVVVAVLFQRIFDIMLLWQAVLFGLIFGLAGQFSDLAESMIKRDANRKDSSEKVPGFGGILDIIDSLLMSGCFAYLFFMLLSLGK